MTIKPCPFCGSSRLQTIRRPDDLFSFVFCGPCGAQGPVEAGKPDDGTPEDRWNRRVSDAYAETGEVERLSKLLSEMSEISVRQLNIAERRLSTLRGALEPFAKMADEPIRFVSEGSCLVSIDTEDFRRARQALSDLKEEGDARPESPSGEPEQSSVLPPASALHELKTWPEEFEAIRGGSKPFEYRKNDRGFKVGDRLRLREYRPDTRIYTAREVTVSVTFVLEGGQFGVPEGYAVLGIVLPPTSETPGKG